MYIFPTADTTNSTAFYFFFVLQMRFVKTALCILFCGCMLLLLYMSFKIWHIGSNNSSYRLKFAKLHETPANLKQLPPEKLTKASSQSLKILLPVRKNSLPQVLSNIGSSLYKV